MSTRSRAFPWWGGRRRPEPWPEPERLVLQPILPQTLLGFPITYVEGIEAPTVYFQRVRYVDDAGDPIW